MVAALYYESVAERYAVIVADLCISFYLPFLTHPSTDA
jgi:hypothetical protein